MAVLDRWEQYFPVDFVTISNLRQRAAEGEVEREEKEGKSKGKGKGRAKELELSFMYVGETIAETAKGRLEQDISQRFPTKLGRFLRVVDSLMKGKGISSVEPASYEIPSLEFAGLRTHTSSGSVHHTADDIWDLNHRLWEVERCLIALAGRTCSLNSAFGGGYTPRLPSPEVGLVLDLYHNPGEEAASQGQRMNVVGHLNTEKVKAIRQHYLNARATAQTLSQTPTSNTSTEKAAVEAALGCEMVDGTTLKVCLVVRLSDGRF